MRSDRQKPVALTKRSSHASDDAEEKQKDNDRQGDTEHPQQSTAQHGLISLRLLSRGNAAVACKFRFLRHRIGGTTDHVPKNSIISKH
jgi:hypothetical protein